MNKLLIKGSFFLASFLLLFAFVPAFSQTIKVGNIDPGPYAPGSTMAVPINIDYTGGCIPQSNTFKLFLSNSSGVYPATPIATFAGFYASFINFTIPAGTSTGTYKVKVTSSSNPGATIIESAPFTINSGGSAVTPTITSTAVIQPDVFGTCNNSRANLPFDFQSTSNAGSIVSNITFINEKTQAVSVVLPASSPFLAEQTNYTVIVKAVNGVSVGTKAYPLLNNKVNNQLGASSNNTVCLLGGVAVINFNIPSNKTDPNTIQDNFPGNIYQVTWGDNLTDSYTLCEIIANGGQISHTYTQSSCGRSAGNGPANAFIVDLQPRNSYCGDIGTKVSSSARIALAPKNDFSFPANGGCTNTTIKFTNGSDPGTDPSTSSTAVGCINGKARYTWKADNGVTLTDAFISDAFKTTFTTPGLHTVILQLQFDVTQPCTAPDIPKQICIQDKPMPAFTLPASPVCTGTYSPTDQSVIPSVTCMVNQYTWTITGPATAAIDNNHSPTPQFTFSTPGVYTVNLTIADPCGGEVAVPKTITVNALPVATLSADANICGINGQTLTFDPTTVDTKTTITGTVDNSATYHWTVTPQGGGNPAAFAAGTDAASQYPHITFPSYGTYGVSVTVNNNCGTTTSRTQLITFNEAPVVDPGPPQNICEGDIVNLNGNVSGTFNSTEWTSSSSGTTGFGSGSSQITTYTPSPADIAAGKVTLTLKANTSITQCSVVQNSIDIFIKPINKVTSAPTVARCSGVPLNYQITDLNNSTSYTWTVDAANTSASATGYATSGTGTIINDNITNTDPNNDATVTYIITPQTSACNGADFPLTVKIAPKAIIASFTQDKTFVCGATTVQFTNTSTSTSTTNNTYSWDFGDGSPLSTLASPPHVFQPLSNGKDIPYPVTLTVSSACSVPQTFTSTVTVNPATPIARMVAQPTSGCGPLTVTLTNTSPANNVSYDYYVFDGATQVQHKTATDKSPVTLDPLDENKATNSNKSYDVYMTATNSCTIIGESIHQTITVSPSSIIPSILAQGSTKGCAPLQVSLINNSSGGLVFKYIVYAADKTTVVKRYDAPDNSVPTIYPFDTPGTFWVSVTASDDCTVTPKESSFIRVDVNPLPAPNFTFVKTDDCDNYTVNFTNATPDNGSTPSQTLEYIWDFGDGTSPSNDYSPSHTFLYATTPYDVSLTAKDPFTGCSIPIIKKQAITVTEPLVSDFSANPGFETSIPNYHFAFIDKTQGSPVSWLWDFGDNTPTSTEPNPQHTYNDVGTFIVTLTTKNKLNCTSTITYNVSITGTPGFLYLPNAFMPSSATTELRTFMAKGKGIKSWHLQIFNGYGQLVWETTSLSENGEPVDGWDGLFKGTPAQQGVYVWQASASFINGTEWKGMSYNNTPPKRVGTINLIR